MNKLTNLKSKLLVEQIEEQIHKYILKEEISIGGKMPNEFQMAEMFGVGRSTIREAVKSLVSKGILEIRRGAGTYVIGTTPTAEDPLGLSGIEDKLSLALDLVDVRMMLEPNIAELAARNATKAQIEELERVCTEVEDRIERGESYIQADIRLHTLIAEASGNKVMEQLIPIIDTAVMMFVNVTHKKLTKETITTHRAVVKAIAAGDLIGAKTAMTMHLIYNRNMIKEIIEKN
ncbi:FadR family transcriptional regulator [Lachnospiraceae bacterium OttesenSCG-928-D06]|nr:FadR family transcriptional regulator [Lachnospiraceae bacterium OttesenSCG-928-D06]